MTTPATANRPTRMRVMNSAADRPASAVSKRSTIVMYLRDTISVTAQDSRSQAINRKLARERLLDAIESDREGQRMAEIAKREKERRRKSPRPAALKRKILESKRRRADLKKQRTKIESD